MPSAAPPANGSAQESKPKKICCACPETKQPRDECIAHGALLVFDILNLDSLQRVEKWVRELRAMEGPQLQIVLVGNKQDMDLKRVVTEEQGHGMAKLIGAPYIATSAKTGDGVHQAFYQIAHLIVLNHPDAKVKKDMDFKGTAYPMQIEEDKSMLQSRSTCC
eukprot:TRINITY_DN4585_c0_g1_i2.p1 TRINITY_DN4585_c0_g1~~TRINITY_DN4585_c0_g1_i2.p1  ORF type:complete len:184 (-),score=15.31 TRINITY_DN4585_c0_g1_i2:347-835(-)